MTEAPVQKDQLSDVSDISLSPGQNASAEEDMAMRLPHKKQEEECPVSSATAKVEKILERCVQPTRTYQQTHTALCMLCMQGRADSVIPDFAIDSNSIPESDARCKDRKVSGQHLVHIRFSYKLQNL